jgi:hypothetical protein
MKSINLENNAQLVTDYTEVLEKNRVVPVPTPGRFPAG